MFNYDVKVFPLAKPSGKLVAFATVIIEGVFEVKDWKIFEGTNGVFAVPPSREQKDKEGNSKWVDTIYFNETVEDGEKAGPVKKEILGAIADAYKSKGKGGSAQQETYSRGGAAKANAEKAKPAGNRRTTPF